MMIRYILLVCYGFVVGIPAMGHAALPTDTLHRLDSLYSIKHYFELEKTLQSVETSMHPHVVFYRAVVAQASNRPAESKHQLDRLMNHPATPDSLRSAGWARQLYNHLRLGAYQEAVQAADSALQFPDLSAAQRQDIQNARLIADALRETPPQRLVERARSILPLSGTHVDVTVNGHARDYAYDTGANFSFLMASEADSLNIPILPAGFQAHTATGGTVTGNVGVADSLTIGQITLTHVVFLVFPDEMLTFPGGFQLRGILGFPVLEALGELHVYQDRIVVPDSVPTRAIHNMVLDELTPLLQFMYAGDTLIGQLDTGANRTVFYAPFFQRYYAAAVPPNAIDTLQAGGVGGVQSFPVYWLSPAQIELAGQTIRFDSSAVYTTPLSSNAERHLYANLGIDLFTHFEYYILNFQSMSLLIRPEGVPDVH